MEEITAGFLVLLATGWVLCFGLTGEWKPNAIAAGLEDRFHEPDDCEVVTTAMAACSEEVTPKQRLKALIGQCRLNETRFSPKQVKKARQMLEACR